MLARITACLSFREVVEVRQAYAALASIFWHPKPDPRFMESVSLRKSIWTMHPLEKLR
jgi:hypothetical protein